MSIHGRRPVTTFLAAALAGIVTLSLVIAPQPSGAARAKPQVVQVDSQVVQLDALLVRSAAMVEKSLGTGVQSDAVSAGVSTAGALASALKVAGSPTSVTASSTSPLTGPATAQSTTNAALAITIPPPITMLLTAICSSTGQACNVLGAIVFIGVVAAVFFLGVLPFGLVFGAIQIVGNCLQAGLSCFRGIPAAAPAAAAGIAVSPAQTEPVVNKLVGLVTTTVNTVKTVAGATLIPQTVPRKLTLLPKPLLAAVDRGVPAGPPPTARNEPPALIASLGTKVTQNASTLIDTLKRADSHRS
jgi:hypothetical protein